MGKSHRPRLAQRAPLTDMEPSPKRVITLPDELVVAILEFLPALPDLRRAAAASRQFYKSAWLAGLYIHREVWCHCGSGYDRSLQVFKQVAEHALAKNLRLSLWLEGPSHTSTADNHAGCSEAIRLLETVLPVLVSLRVGSFRDETDKLNAALQCPAPRLRSLMLGFCDCGEDTRASTLMSTHLFAGFAPRLRELGVQCLKCNLGPGQLPAFAHISHLQVRYRAPLHPLVVKLHLPKLSHLELACVTDDLAIPIDPSGISLKSLVFQDFRWRDPLPNLSLGLQNTPEFHYIGRANWHAVDWAGLFGRRTVGDSALNVRLSVPEEGYGDGISISVVSANRAWRRSYHFRTEYPIVVMLEELSGLRARLAYIRLATDFLEGLVRCMAEFPALQTIRVEIARGNRLFQFRTFIEDKISACNRSCGLRFPELALVSLLWTGPNDAERNSGNNPGVLSQDVELLARALGTGARHPALELVGLDVEIDKNEYDKGFCSREAVAHDDPVRNLFSNILKVPSPSPNSCAVIDEGLWEDRDSMKLNVFPLHCLPR